MRLTRRQLLGAAAGLAGGAGATKAGRAAAASLDPVTDILEAYVATLVPGIADDPAGTPGAVEAGAVAELWSQVPYAVPLVLADVTAAALLRTGRGFAALPYAEREALLVDAFADPVRSVYHLIALAIGAGTFYGDFRNRVGGQHLGFPGPAPAGYLDTYTDRTGHGQPQADAVPP